MEPKHPSKRKILSKDQSRIDKDSYFFEKVIPILLLGMAGLTIVLILFAVGVLVGLVNF